ncbi:MAG: ATP-binding protein [Gemmataceae bacterium]
MMLIAMAGLPGTGKSTLAARIAEWIGGVVLNKDVVRAELFPVVEYTREQDDAAVAWMYEEASRRIAEQPVIIDGRTFSKAYQVRDLFEAAARMGVEPRIIECVASDDAVKRRLERDMADGSHPAKNRTFEMYQEVKRLAEPLMMPRLTLDTGILPLDECVGRAIPFFRGISPPDAAP